MNFRDPTLGLAARFQGFARGLYIAIEKYAGEHRLSPPLIRLIFNRLMNRSRIFTALVARFEAGTLRPARTLRLGARAKPEGAPDCAKPARAPDPVPRRRAYLLELGKHEAAYYMGVLETLMADPQMLALLEASPQARRLLRPLWRMLNPRPLPDALRPPPRPPASEALPVAAIASQAAVAAPPHAYARPPRVRRLRSRAVPRSGTGPLVPA